MLDGRHKVCVCVCGKKTWRGTYGYRPYLFHLRGMYKRLLVGSVLHARWTLCWRAVCSVARGMSSPYPCHEQGLLRIELWIIHSFQASVGKGFLVLVGGRTGSWWIAQQRRAGLRVVCPHAVTHGSPGVSIVISDRKGRQCCCLMGR